jgi:hypothetical protein
MNEARTLTAIKMALLLVIPASFLLCGKLVAIPFMLIAGACYWRLVYRNANYKPVILAILMFWAVNLQPVDVWFIKTPHGIGLRKVAWGYPGSESRIRAKSGECILGGCAIYSNCPRYVLTF